MIRIICFFFISFFVSPIFSQKDSLQLGDRYAEDQIYVSVSYAQFGEQPTSISRSAFSYGISTGFLKDFILNKKGTTSIALGVGYGFDFFNHKLKVSEINNSTLFNSSENITSNVFKSHNLEFPLEIRWRTSTSKKYDFWRIYSGIKFLYNISNVFQFTEDTTDFKYKNVSAYRKLQYGLTFSAGYSEFNAYLFYGLTPILSNASIDGENISSNILKFGLAFYIL
tara:strand:+ start:256 stop:930 length:675 start_codon:yes stop_codon:yes gene_type:complete